jgi:cytochrome c biogenesis protein CcdA
LGDNSDIVDGKTSTSIHILTGYGPTPLSFSLTVGRKHSHKDIKLVEEMSLGFLAGAVTIALPLGLLAGAVAKTLILLLRHLKLRD